MGHSDPRGRFAAPTGPQTPDDALALGTVQFGRGYGVAGRGEAVPEDEVRAILEYADSVGIRILDTSPSYGDIEARLAALISDLPFWVVSKIDPLPPVVDSEGAVRVVNESVSRSLRRLGPRLSAILFHRAEDLLGRSGDVVWRAAESATGGRLRLGVSCYDPQTLIELRKRFPIAVAQVPGNVFDQRVAAPEVVERLQGVEIHVRSVFLQGLLLMPVSEAARQVPASVAAITAWADWCSRLGVERISMALGVVRSFPGIRHWVVGVDRLAHLIKVTSAWAAAPPIDAPSLACESLDVIDPRRWGAA
jgi:aryl-alcohol dehydrogenase-like predicted oxidoreductase